MRSLQEIFYQSPKKVNRPRDDCAEHVFCVDDPIPRVDGDHLNLPENMAVTGSRDLDRMKQHVLFPEDMNGEYVGHDQLLKEANQNYHFFGNDYEINTNGVPADRKLVITDEVLNQWLASQWENFSLNNVPINKPLGMDAALHKRFLVQSQQLKEEQNRLKQMQQSSNSYNSVRFSGDGVGQKLGSIIEGSFNSKAQLNEEKQQKVVLSCDIVPRLPQNNFKVQTYDANAKFISFVDLKIKEAEKRKEEEERLRELRRLNKFKDSKHNIQKNGLLSPNFDVLKLKNPSNSSHSELCSQFNREQSQQYNTEVIKQTNLDPIFDFSVSGFQAQNQTTQKQRRINQLRKRSPPFFQVTKESSLPKQKPQRKTKHPCSTDSKSTLGPCKNNRRATDSKGHAGGARYKQPNELVRKRLQSEYLNKMMNQSEIENLVQKITQYNKQIQFLKNQPYDHSRSPFQSQPKDQPKQLIALNQSHLPDPNSKQIIKHKKSQSSLGILTRGQKVDGSDNPVNILGIPETFLNRPQSGIKLNFRQEMRQRQLADIKERMQREVRVTSALQNNLQSETQHSKIYHSTPGTLNQKEASSIAEPLPVTLEHPQTTPAILVAHKDAKQFDGGLQSIDANDYNEVHQDKLVKQRTRNFNKISLVDAHKTPISRRQTQTMGAKTKTQNSLQHQIVGLQGRVNKKASMPLVQVTAPTNDMNEDSEQVNPSINLKQSIFKRFTKTSSYNHKAKRALFDSELKKYTVEESDFKDSANNKAIHKRGNSVMSIPANSEKFDKMSQYNIQKQLRQKKYATLTTSQRGFENQFGSGKKLKQENEIELPYKISHEDKVFDETTDDYHIVKESPRVKTAISIQDFFTLFRKKGENKNDDNQQKESKEEDMTDQVIQSIISKQLDSNALYLIKDSMPTNQKRINQNVVADIQHKRRLENILNQNYLLQVKKIEMPGHLKHLDERTITSQAHCSTQAGSIALTSTQLPSKSDYGGSVVSKSNSALDKVIGEVKMSQQYLAKGFHRPSKKFIENDLKQLNAQSSRQLQTESDSLQADSAVNEPKNLEDALQHCQNELKQAVINDLNDGIRVLSDKEKQFQSKYLKGDPKNYLNVEIQIKKLSVTDTISKIYKKGFNDFRFWLQKSQLSMRHPRDWEPALDYLTSGLRELPLSVDLLYNYACINEKLGRPHIALKFFQHARELRPRWTDALFGEAVTYFKLGNYRKSQESISLAISNFKQDSSVDFGVMLYFQAMCYKKLGEFQKARRDYVGLLALYNQSEGQKLLNHVVACVLLPLNEDRLYQFEFMENTLSLIQFFQPCPPLESYARLDQPNCLVDGTSKFATNLLMLKLLQSRPFFNRYKIDTLKQFTPHASLEYFEKDDIIFLNGRVGVITHGSVRIFSHKDNVSDPKTIGRFKAGRILGHGDTDKNITLHSQTWLVVFDSKTEIVFFPKDKFDKLWKLQNSNHQKTILNFVLAKNQIWNILSLQTQLELINNGVEVRKYRPGQLISRINKRSTLIHKVYGKFTEPTTSKFKDELEKAKCLEKSLQRQKGMMGHNQKSIQHSIDSAGRKAGSATQETVLQGFVRTLTSVNPGQTKLMKSVSPELETQINTTLNYGAQKQKKCCTKNKARFELINIKDHQQNTQIQTENNYSDNNQQLSPVYSQIQKQANEFIGSDQKKKRVKIQQVVSHRDASLSKDTEQNIIDVLDAERKVDEQLENMNRCQQQANDLFKSLDPDEQDVPSGDDSTSLNHDHDHSLDEFSHSHDQLSTGPKLKLSILRKPRRIDFDSVMQKILISYSDYSYKETDGLYIIFYGQVDVINPFTRQKIYQLGINESFGESRLLKNTGIDYMGDIYAGLYPLGRDNHQKSNTQPKKNESYQVVSLESENNERCELLQIVENKEECVLCIFIPQMRLEQIIPGNEREELQDYALKDAKRQGLIHLMSGLYNIDSQSLQNL